MDRYFQINDLSVGFKTFEGEKQTLDIERITIQPGETFGLVGESGAGKTVLALSILQLLPTPPGIIRNGEIWFKEQNLLQKSRREMQALRGKKISMIFQDPMSTLNPVFTVGEQIRRVIEKHQGIKGNQATRKSIEMLELVKLADSSSTIHKYPHELSGGQRQRVIIAIALSCGAEFLIADEPTRNLDVTIQAGILKLIGELQKELGIGVLFIANNMGLVNVICDQVAILYRGKIVEMGDASSVIRSASHPYTRVLLSAIPRTKNEKMTFAQTIVRAEAVSGCPYYSRCPKAIDECRSHNPLLHSIQGSHEVACIRIDEEVKS